MYSAPALMAADAASLPSAASAYPLIQKLPAFTNYILSSLIRVPLIHVEHIDLYIRMGKTYFQYFTGKQTYTLHRYYLFH